MMPPEYEFPNRAFRRKEEKEKRHRKFNLAKLNIAFSKIEQTRLRQFHLSKRLDIVRERTLVRKLSLNNK